MSTGKDGWPGAPGPAPERPGPEAAVREHFASEPKWPAVQSISHEGRPSQTFAAWVEGNQPCHTSVLFSILYETLWSHDYWPTTRLSITLISVNCTFTEVSLHSGTLGVNSVAFSHSFYVRWIFLILLLSSWRSSQLTRTIRRIHLITIWKLPWIFGFESVSCFICPG